MRSPLSKVSLSRGKAVDGGLHTLLERVEKCKFNTGQHKTSMTYLSNAHRTSRSKRQEVWVSGVIPGNLKV